MIGDEPYAPYQRPPLSKKFLTERPPADTLYFRPEKFWREQGVTPTFGVRGQGHRSRRQARDVLPTAAKPSTRRCFFRPGRGPRDPPLPGARPRGVFSLRKIDDVRRLRGAAGCRQHVVIVGGGYIGLEVAAVARGEGRDVTVLEAEERVMKRVTSPVISDFMQDFHRARGVDIRLGARLAAIEGDAQGVAGDISRTARACPPISCCSRSAPGRTTNSRQRRARLRGRRGGGRTWPHRRSGDLRGGDCTRFPSGRYGRQAAARMRAERDRPGQGGGIRASSASRSSTIRCRGSGRTSTSSSCRWRG